MCKEMLKRRCMFWQGSNVTRWQLGGGVACMTLGRNARKLLRDSLGQYGGDSKAVTMPSNGFCVGGRHVAKVMDGRLFLL